MKICYHCGKKMDRRDTYIENDKYLGVISIPNVKYFACQCGEESISGEILQKVDEEYDRLLSKLLFKRLSSMDDINEKFMPNRELVAKLGKTRQAIAKDFLLPRKIFNIVLFGQRFYLRESVDLFISTGDGRFPLFDECEKQIPKFPEDKTIDSLTAATCPPSPAAAPPTFAR